jgi:hypothetical protein
VTRWLGGGVSIVLMMGAGSVAAESIEHLEISHDNGRYQIALRARLNSPAADSFRVFSDFANLPQINNAIEEVEVLSGAAAGSIRLRTRIRVCVSFFCRHLQQVQDIHPLSAGDTAGLEATVLPAYSNLRFGHAVWMMDACGEQTCLRFNAELEPDFWVPPLIGPWAIDRAMRREAVQTSQGIERLAQQRAVPK